MENRRVKLTKIILKESLIELLIKENLANITVTELCNYADINRSTFYSHYQDLNAVLDEMEMEFISHVSYLRIGESTQKQLSRFIEYLNYIHSNKNLFLVLFKNGRIVKPVCDKSMELYLKEIQLNNIKDHNIDIHKAFVQFATTGTFQLISNWLENEGKYTSEQLAKWLLDLSIEIRKIEQTHSK